MRKMVWFFRIGIIVVPCVILYLLFRISFEESLRISQVNGVVINEIMSNNLAFETEDIGYCDWIEIFNGSGQTVNLQNYGLSDTSGNPFKWKFPDIDLAEGEYIIIVASSDEIDYAGLCCGFALDKKGGEVLLTAPDGEMIDCIKYGEMEYDVSYGRASNDINSFGCFGAPTPGRENGVLAKSVDGAKESVAQVYFGLDSGFYEHGTTVRLETDENATILYTLDGSIPTIDSYIYREPIELEALDGFDAVVVRAAAYRNNMIGPVSTATYFLCERSKYNLPLLSLVADPDSMFGEDGIFVSGSTARIFTARGYKAEASNITLNTKIPAVLQFKEGKDWISVNTKIKVRGVSSRGYAEKNLSLQLEEPFLISGEYADDAQISSLKLKAQGAGDPLIYCKTSTFIENVVSVLDIGTTGSRLVNLFINGEYWGIYCIQENEDSYYTRHYGLSDSDRITVKISPDILGEKNDIGNWKKMVEFSNATESEQSEYKELYERVTSGIIDSEVGYEWVYEYIDVDNFIDYIAAELFWANVDWPGNNVEIWRSKTVNEDNPYADMRWRWRLYDMDCCMAGWLGASDDYIRWNALGYLLTCENNGDDGICFEPALFQYLWNDADFRLRFLSRFMELLDTTYSEEELLKQFETHKALLQSDIVICLTKLNSGFIQTKEGAIVQKTVDEWNDNMQYFEQFLSKRGEYCREMIQGYMR